MVSGPRIITRAEHSRGMTNPNAKLSDQLVTEIVRRVRSGESQSDVARAIGVHRVTVGHILRGKYWCHVTRAIPGFTPNKPGIRKGEDHHSHRLTEANVIDVRQRLAAGQSVCSIARRFRVRPRAIDAIKRGTGWKHVPATGEVHHGH